MVADYNSDNVINGSDLTVFLGSWENENFVNELGPYSGSVPNLVVHPDQTFDIEDVMSFVVIGNWYLSNFGIVALGQPTVDSEIIYNIDGSSISISLPDEVTAVDIRLDYDPAVFSSDFVVPNDEITLVKKNQDLGILDIIAEARQRKDIILPYDLDGSNTHINLYVQAYGSEGNVLSNMVERIEINSLPNEFSLSQNYPNPFNPVTHINYDLPVGGFVRLTIFDLMGREVVRLIDKEQKAGYQSISWNGSDSNGQMAGTGVYYYAIEMGDYRKVRKMILLK